MAGSEANVTLSTIEHAFEELRAGKPVLVADDFDRENEVDAIISASEVTQEWMAWIIRHSSGYICAPMTNERADELNLPIMVANSQDERHTAYTVSVDASHGVTTGISAGDRTVTLRALANPESGPDAIIRPGHVLPLRAVDGGVFARGGHTEASVDLCRLAGLPAVAGIAELIRDDGKMTRLDEAVGLAEAEGLAIVTIAQLREWRKAAGDMPSGVPETAAELSHRVTRRAVAKLPTQYGDFTVIGYRDIRTGAEHVALTAPGTEGGAAAGGLADPHGAHVVRVHSECFTGEALASLRCDCGPQLHEAMRQVARRGGAVIYLRGQEGRGIGLLEKLRAYALQDEGRDTVDANTDLGWPVDRREYGAAAAILADLGIDGITLLTNNPAKVDDLRGHGVAITAVERLEVGLDPHNHDYLETKATRMGHHLLGAESLAADTSADGGADDEGTQE